MFSESQLRKTPVRSLTRVSQRRHFGHCFLWAGDTVLCSEELSCAVQGARNPWHSGTQSQASPLAPAAPHFQTRRGLCTSPCPIFTDGQTGPEKDSGKWVTERRPRCRCPDPGPRPVTGPCCGWHRRGQPRRPLTRQCSSGLNSFWPWVLPHQLSRAGWGRPLALGPTRSAVLCTLAQGHGGQVPELQVWGPKLLT